MDRFIYANPVSYKKFKEDKNMSKTIATQIAEAAVNTKFENLSEDAVLHAKTCPGIHGRYPEYYFQ